MMDYKCSKDEFEICENNAKCYLCDGKRLYEEPKWMKLSKRRKENKLNKVPKKKKEGMDFEKRAAKRYNKSVAKIQSTKANRTLNSGAIWSMPGDIVTKNELIECKERGSTTSRGEKTITIQKQQLDKIKEEAFLAKKNIWYYLFAFKGSNDIYVTKDFEDELAMIEQIELLKHRVLELEELLDGKN